MFKPEKNLNKLSLNRHVVLFFQDFSQFGVSHQLLLMILCHTATKSTFVESVMLVDVWNEQKHAWPLREAWLTRKRRLKREKNGLESEREESFPLSSLSLLHFFSFSPASFTCTSIFSFTYDFTRRYLTPILEYFCQGQVFCSGQLYFQLLWEETCDALSFFFNHFKL